MIATLELMRNGSNAMNACLPGSIWYTLTMMSCMMLGCIENGFLLNSSSTPAKTKRLKANGLVTAGLTRAQTQQMVDIGLQDLFVEQAQELGCQSGVLPRVQIVLVLFGTIRKKININI